MTTSIGAEVLLLAFLDIDSTLRSVTAADLSHAARVFDEFDPQNVVPILCTGGTSRELDTSRDAGYRASVARRGRQRRSHPARLLWRAPVRGARVGPVWEVLEFGRTRSRVIDSIAAIASRLDITVEMPTPLTESRGLFHGTIMGLRSRTWI
jgi:hypothetical protein